MGYREAFLYICSMPEILNIADFLQPVSLNEISLDGEYHDGQFGKEIAIYENENSDISAADIVIVGCAEQRGQGPLKRRHRQT